MHRDLTTAEVQLQVAVKDSELVNRNLVMYYIITLI